MAVSVTSRVHGKVSSLVIERNGNLIKASFKVPASMSGDDKYDRATWIDHELRMDRAGVKPVGLAVGESTGPGMQRTDADRFWIRGHSMSASVEKSFNRSRYHPISPGRYCKQVSWGTFGGNIKAGSGWGASMQNIGPVVWATRTVGLPRKPSVSWTYNQEQSKATVTIKTDAGKDWNERYDTLYQVTLRKVDGTEKTLRGWTASRATEITATFDLSPYMGASMSAGKWVTIKCQAYARGMAGDNPSKANAVTATRTVYWPSAATLGTVTCSSKASTGRVTIPVTTTMGASMAASVQQQLQRRHGADGNWEDVSGATDNGDCKALYDTYGDAAPVAGEYIYYRVKSTRDQFTQYSAAKRADCLFTAKPKVTCSATVGIVSVTPSSSGTTATVVMGWSDSTSNTGWELSWSDYSGAWNATEGPSTDSGTSQDATRASTKYKATKTRLMNGLEPGKTYYVRVRRYREVDGGETLYSAHSAAFSFTTESAKDDLCGIISCSPSKAGTSCTVVVGYTEDTTNTGTELSWSTSSGAWSSSSIEPSTHDYPTAGTASPTKWGKQVSLIISELTSGTTYYVRARRYKTVDGANTYTPYSAAQSFRTESAADDKCGIISVAPGTTGKTATVTIGFNEDNANTGTEVEWSTDSAAWHSNVPPESLKATWPRLNYTGSGWSYYQNVYLRNLTPGKTYYINARRYLEAGGNTTYSPRSKTFTFKTPRMTAANDKCGIVSVTRHSDNTGANVIVGWTEDTANDGTELSWSTDKDAWTSNQQPSKLQATWSDKTSKSESWKKTQVISLHGLERGETYYIRARRYRNDDEGETFSPYSPTVSITLPIAKADGDVRCGLLSVTGQSDGTSAVVVIGWSGDHTGCEVTWSKDPNAWESSEAPQSLQFDWQDATRKSTTWSHTSTCYLRNLEEGQTYYVRARSYYERDGTVWSDYTGDKSVTPHSAPDSVTLSAPDAVARGEAIECWWSVSGDIEQTHWVMHREGQPKKALASGKGSLCHVSIPASKYKGLDTISFYVDVSTGGGMTSSNVASVGIADYPGCEAACAAELTAQPASFEAYTDNDATSLLCTLRADGVTVSAPDGDRDQLPGDVVWTELITPTWTATTWGATELYSQLSDAVDAAQDAYDDAQAAHEADPTDEDLAIAAENAATALADAQAALAAHVSTDAVNVATVTLPDTLDLWDGAGYTLSVQTVEPVAGLVSDTATCHMDVAWAHQAFAPAATLTVDSENRSVAITLQSGTPAADVAVTGESVEMGDGTFKSLAVDGKSVQDGTPTPSNPVPVQVVGGRNLVFKRIERASVDPNGKIIVNNAIDLLVAKVDNGGVYTVTQDWGIFVCGFYATEPVMDAVSYNSSRTQQAAQTVTAPINGYIAVWTKTGYQGQIESGTHATPYVPYGCIGLKVGETVTPIDLQGNVLASLPDGTKDVLTIDGAGNVTLEKRVGAVDLGGLSWSYSSSGGGFFFAALNTAKPTVNGSTMANDLCAKYSAGTPNQVYSGLVDFSIAQNTNANLMIHDTTAGTDAATFTAAMSGVILYYELATPTTIDLGTITLPEMAQGESVSVSAAVTPSLTLTRHVDGFLSTDVYDVYRMTPAGHELVAESIPMGGELADPFAPFGTDDLHYRIALRTVDGDFAFDDFPYVLKVGGIRFDWDGRHVELPWNVQLSESYKKDFETRSHADGSTEGYFGPAVGMTGGFSTDLIKVDDAQLRLVRELASYPGAVFCRTSAGTAFQCNVDVSELSMGCRSGVAAVSLDVTRVALTEQFKCNGGDAA